MAEKPIVGSNNAQKAVDGLERSITQLTRAIDSKATPSIMGMARGFSGMTQNVNSARRFGSDLVTGKRTWSGWGQIGGGASFNSNANVESSQGTQASLGTPPAMMGAKRRNGGDYTARHLVDSSYKPRHDNFLDKNMSYVGRHSTATAGAGAAGAAGAAVAGGYIGKHSFSALPVAAQTAGALGAGVLRPGVAAPVAAGASGIAAGFGYLKNLSSSLLTRTSGYDYALRQGAIAMGGSNKDYERANTISFGTSKTGTAGFGRIATNFDDAGQAVFTARRSTGALMNSSTYRQFQTQATGLGLMDPTLGAAGAAGVMREMYSAPNYYRMQAMGYETPIGPGGKKKDPRRVFDSIYKGTTGRKSTDPVKAEQLEAMLADSGSLSVNMNAVGMSDQAQSAFSNYARNRNTAMLNGMSAGEFDKLLDEGASGKQGSLDTLAKKSGIGKSQLESTQKAMSAANRTESQIMDDFSNALVGATDMLKKFTENVTEFLEKTGLDKLLGKGAAWGGALGQAGALPFGGIAAGAGIAEKSNKWFRDKVFGRPKTDGLGGDGPAGFNDSTSSRSGAPKPAAGSTQSQGATGGSFIAAAAQHIGKPYVWGAAGPRAFDCSGLTLWAYKKVTGRTLPHKASIQWTMTKPVAAKDARPGDLIFFNGTSRNKHHVGIYTGNGKMLHAPRAGKPVQISKIWSESHVFGRLPGINPGMGGGSMATPTGAGSEPTQKDNPNASGDTGSPYSGGDSVTSVGAPKSAYGSINEVEALASVMQGGGGGSAGGSFQNKGASGEPAASEADAPAESQTEAPVGSSVGGSAPATAGNSPAQNKALGRQLAAKYGWDKGGNWDALVKLWHNESGWKHQAANPTSSARGIPQRMMSLWLGKDWKNNDQDMAQVKNWMSNPRMQIEWGLDYIKGRRDYGNPIKAWSKWQSRSPHWYDQGAWDVKDNQHAVVHKGEMIIPARKAETIRQALIKDSIPIGGNAKMTGGAGVNITFADGSIRVEIGGGGSTEESARTAARMIVDQIAEDDRLKKIGVGR